MSRPNLWASAASRRPNRFPAGCVLQGWTVPVRRGRNSYRTGGPARLTLPLGQGKGPLVAERMCTIREPSSSPASAATRQGAGRRALPGRPPWTVAADGVVLGCKERRARHPARPDRHQTPARPARPRPRPPKTGAPGTPSADSMTEVKTGLPPRPGMGALGNASGATTTPSLVTYKRNARALTAAKTRSRPRRTVVVSQKDGADFWAPAWR